MNFKVLSGIEIQVKQKKKYKSKFEAVRKECAEKGILWEKQHLCFQGREPSMWGWERISMNRSL